MALFDLVDSLLDRIVFELSQVEGYHLGRSVDAGCAMNIHLLSIP
jgi:hypothetical protein